MSDNLNDRAERAFNGIKGWSSLNDLNQVADYVDVSRVIKKRTFIENFDSWLAIKHPRIAFISFLFIIADVVINLSK